MGTARLRLDAARLRQRTLCRLNFALARTACWRMLREHYAGAARGRDAVRVHLSCRLTGEFLAETKQPVDLGAGRYRCWTAMGLEKRHKVILVQLGQYARLFGCRW